MVVQLNYCTINELRYDETFDVHDMYYILN